MKVTCVECHCLAEVNRITPYCDECADKLAKRFDEAQRYRPKR